MWNRELKDMDFLIILNICVQPGFNETAVAEAGYETKPTPMLGYFFGQSKHNSSLYGWAGQTNTSGVQSSVEEVQRRVSRHTKESVFKRIFMQIRNFETVEMKKDDMCM